MADQQYNPTQQGMYDGGQQNLNYKIPQIKGEVKDKSFFRKP